MSTIPDVVQRATEQMEKAIESTKRELSTVRTGKASTSLLDLVRVEAYGSVMPLNQVGLLAAPEPRLLTIQPFDKSLTGAIEKAILEADLGLNPASHGELIRIPLPLLTEERRRELVRLIHKLSEEGKIAIRHARQEAINKIKKLEHTSSDDKSRGEKEVQRLTDDHVKRVDDLIAAKEAEIMEV